MKDINNLPDANKILTQIMYNNALFFNNTGKNILDYVNLTFESFATITLKPNAHLTPEIVRELKSYFGFKEN